MRSRKQSLHHPSIQQHQTNLRLEQWHRRSVYAVCVALALTGVLWLVAHYWMRAAGEFGETVHPLEPWSMKFHGAAAMAALFFAGSLLNGHIRRAVKTRRNLWTGWSMVVVFTALVLSGYGLYYLASDISRPFWSVVHWLIGLTFPALLILHIAIGRISRS